MVDSYKHLVKGYRHFHDRYIGGEFDAYRDEASGSQSPPVLIVGCCDSRVNPAILTEAGLGEIFVVNNVANIVPPYQEGPLTHHSTSAAIEYAVNVLAVEHIIVLGHSNCGGIRALLTGAPAPGAGRYSFLANWIEIVADARKSVTTIMEGAPLEKQLNACEKEAILISLDNLKGFPFVKVAVEDKRLQLHGWHFDITSGEILAWEPNGGPFVALSHER